MERSRHLGSTECLASGALRGREQFHSAAQQDFHSQGHPLSCLLSPTHPIADRWLSCPFEKQSIFPETGTSEVLVLDLGLSGLEDHEAHRRQMALGDSREAQGRPYQCNPPLSLCLLLT